MTAETLKPFITPQTVDNFPATQSSTTRRQRHSSYLAIGVGVAGVTLAAILLGFTILHSVRITTLETDLKTLNRVVESMQKRLGLHYLDDLHDFEKEYTNALIDDPNTLVGNLDDDNDEVDDDEDDDDDDLDDDLDEDEDERDVDEYDEIEDYEDLVKSYNNYNESDEDEDDGGSNISDDDNLYDDFEKYQDAKKKKQSTRKTRALANVRNELPIYEESYIVQLNKSANGIVTAASQEPASEHRQQPILRTLHLSNADHNKNKIGHKRHIVAENMDPRHSLLRPRSSRKRKIPIVKSGDSLISAKSTGLLMNAVSFKPAAHFHLNRKIPDRHAVIKVDSYPGDMYIGHPSWTNEIASEQYFNIENGVLTVREAGLYYVYAQICYNNTHDQNGFVIFHGHRPFLQCLNTVPTNMPLKIHTCHTSGLIYLKPDETIHLRDFHSDRNAILKETNNRSYFGLMKI